MTWWLERKRRTDRAIELSSTPQTSRVSPLDKGEKGDGVSLGFGVLGECGVQWSDSQTRACSSKVSGVVFETHVEVATLIDLALPLLSIKR